MAALFSDEYVHFAYNNTVHVFAADFSYSLIYKAYARSSVHGKCKNNKEIKIKCRVFRADTYLWKVSADGIPRIPEKNSIRPRSLFMLNKSRWMSTDGRNYIVVKREMHNTSSVIFPNKYDTDINLDYLIFVQRISYLNCPHSYFVPAIYSMTFAFTTLPPTLCALRTDPMQRCFFCNRKIL